jgi:hypothetical protein
MVANAQKQIKMLDDERRAIQTRIGLRAKQENGVPLTHAEDVLLQGKPSVYQDAARYVFIQDEQWRLLGIEIHNEHAGDVLPI